MERSEQLKKRLQAEKVPQWRLAKAVGVSENTLYRQLRQEITEERFEELSAAMDVITKGGSDE